MHRRRNLVNKIVFGMLLVPTIACGAAARNPATVDAFKAANPCPATGQIQETCPGYIVDHKYPLCAGGKDEVANMQWQTREQSYVKDRIEHELCALKAKCQAK